MAPTFQCTSSIASRTIGETPVTQRTTAIQASHEMLRSTMRTQRTPGKVRLRTRTLRRMTTSEIRIGIATLNTAGLTVPASSDARRVGQGEREDREQDAVEDVVAEPDRGDRPRRGRGSGGR